MNQNTYQIDKSYTDTPLPAGSLIGNVGITIPEDSTKEKVTTLERFITKGLDPESLIASYLVNRENKRLDMMARSGKAILSKGGRKMPYIKCGNKLYYKIPQSFEVIVKRMENKNV